MTAIKSGQKILDARRAMQKLDRMAYQILENNYQEESLVLIGIEPGGNLLSEQLASRLRKISSKEIFTGSIYIDKPQPDPEKVVLVSSVNITGKPVILVDDVGNTGRTLFFAMYPLFRGFPKKVEVAVLVDRFNKTFPIKADFVGFPLATTLNEHVAVNFDEQGLVEGAYLY